MNHISEIVQQLVSQYGTRDPFIIAQNLGIIVLYKPYAELQGYYSSIFEQQFIVINSHLNKTTQKIVMAHELGRACLYPNQDMVFIENLTPLHMDYSNDEISLFAAELLLTDDIYDKYRDFSVNQLAIMHDVPPALIKIKLNSLSEYFY